VEGDGTVTGLIVSADELRDGPEAVVVSVLHSAAHILNWRRGIQDTTTRGAYHTQAFLTAGEEVGLIWPADAKRSSTRGFIDVVLSDAARARHADDISTLEQLIPEALPHLEVSTSKRSSTPGRLTMACQCDPARTFRISKTVEAAGPILCGVCGKPFVIK
jgi:hypothetical protein